MEQVSVERLALVHPHLAQLITAVYDQLAEEGMVVRVVQGLRTVAQQNALYAQGRTASGSIVTNARGGYSAHNFGYAVDLVPGSRSVADHDITRPWLPNWNPKSLDFQRMIQVAKGTGLVAGADWASFPDPPHFQLPGLPVTPTNPMRACLQSKGLEGFWAAYVQPASPQKEDARDHIYSV